MVKLKSIKAAERTQLEYQRKTVLQIWTFGYRDRFIPNQATPSARLSLTYFHSITGAKRRQTVSSAMGWICLKAVKSDPKDPVESTRALASALALRAYFFASHTHDCANFGKTTMII
jgi:hypothetical protein